MVLYKRKVVEIPQPSFFPPDDTLVWYIDYTGEYYATYDDYLNRMDFYTQKKFICELTGHSCLTFFEAMQSEVNETHQVIQTFPESLKEPILRRAQFSQISRLDGLVDDVYNSLRNEFYPGEIVIAKIKDQRIKVLIREKARFNSIILDNGEYRPSYTKFRVEVMANPGQEMAVDENQLIRDRKLFTKIILRTFIKYAVTREAWAGAPWIVKPEYAEMYRIDQELPDHLLKLTQDHQKEAKRRAFESPGPLPPHLSPGQNGSRLIMFNQHVYPQQQHPITLPPLTSSVNSGSMETYMQYAPYGAQPQPYYQPQTAYQGQYNGQYGQQPYQLNQLPTAHIGADISQVAPQVRSLPVVMEDLVIPPEAISAVVKPKMHFELSLEKSDRHLVGSLLETWSFLNIYHEPLVLDPFTFDNFVDMLRYADEDDECELLEEIHCSLLSQIVGTRSSALLVEFPKEPHDDIDEDDIEEDDDEDGEEDEDTNENDSKVKSEKENVEGEAEDGEKKGSNGEINSHEHDSKKGTKDTDDKEQEKAADSNSEEDDDDDDDENDNDGLSDGEEDEKEEEEDDFTENSNKSEQFSRYQSQDWTERLRKRMFKDGGWQQILIGFLYSVSYVPEWSKTCEEILDEMASLKRSVSLASASRGYFALSMAQKIHILRILCDLISSSNVIRDYIDSCMEASTKLRRERLDNQRQIRTHVDSMRVIDDSKRPFYAKALADRGGELDEAQAIADGRKRLEDTKKEEFDKILSEESEEFAKLLEDYEEANGHMQEALDKIKDIDKSLVKLDIQRVKCLGRDRYYNQYWWFESNGMERPKIPEAALETDVKVEAEADTKAENNFVKEEAADASMQDADSSLEKVEKDAKEEDEESDDEENGSSRKTRTRTRLQAKAVVVDESSDEAEIDGEIEDELASLEDEPYAMGRLWIQGPSEEDLEIRLKQQHLEDDFTKYSSTLAPIFPRKEADEGGKELMLKDYNDWRYYETVDELDGLLVWLNQRGKRELKLSRELQNYRALIAAGLNARQEVLKQDEVRRSSEVEEILQEEVNGGDFGNSRDTDTSDTSDEEKATDDEKSDDDDEEDGGDNSETEDSDSSESNSPVQRRRSSRLNGSSTNSNNNNNNNNKKKEKEKRREAAKPKPPRIPKTRSQRKPQLSDAEKAKIMEERRKEVKKELENSIPTRVLQWANSSALKTLGHSHYDSYRKSNKGR